MAITTELKVPGSLQVEHNELHEELGKAMQESGRVGEAARSVERVLHQHFEKEEEYALPPLGLLQALVRGDPLPDANRAFEMAERLKSDLSGMLDEHKAVVAELKNLADVANAEGRPEYVRFAERLMLHARTEEEVLYPAVILIGEYLKLKR